MLALLLSATALSATTVKPSPLMALKGQALAVSSDGKTLATSDGKRVYLYPASGKKPTEVSKGLGAGVGPLVAVGTSGFVVQLMGEKKKRFAFVGEHKAEPVPFRLPKEGEVPALAVAFAREASTLVGLLSPAQQLTDVLAWDFSQKPPVESPRTGLATYCWTIWTEKTRAHALCEDGVHNFELVPPGNNNQTGAADETVKVPRGAMAVGEGARLAWVTAGELFVDDFTDAEGRIGKSAKLPAAASSIAFVPGTKIVAAALPSENVVWLWDYTAQAAGLSRVKVAGPKQLVVSEQPGQLWVRAQAGVLRLDVEAPPP